MLFIFPASFWALVLETQKLEEAPLSLLLINTSSPWVSKPQTADEPRLAGGRAADRSRCHIILLHMYAYTHRLRAPNYSDNWGLRSLNTLFTHTPIKPTPQRPCETPVLVPFWFSSLLALLCAFADAVLCSYPCPSLTQQIGQISYYQSDFIKYREFCLSAIVKSSDITL